MRLKRWIAGLLLVAMFANFAGLAACLFLDEVAHETEMQALDAGSAASDAHCKHGCVGHATCHLQGQVRQALHFASPFGTESAVVALASPHEPRSPAPPYRPPRAA